MKKLSIIFPLLVGAFLMVACETDRDDNPTIDLSKKQEAITLNIPTFANSTYDLANTDSVTLTCTAPNYGFPATTTYVVQLSIDEDMSNPSELTTTYYLNRMVVPGREIAMATTKQMINKKGLKQEDFPVETAAYLRIRAFIEGTPETETLSNIVKLNKIKTKFALPDVTMPDSMFVIGTFTDNDWKKSVKTIQVNNSTQNHWRMVWMDSKGVRLSPIQGEPNFSDNMITPIHVCNTTGFSVSSDGVVTAEKPGWYVMLIEGTGNNEKRHLIVQTYVCNPDFEAAIKEKIGNNLDTAEIAPLIGELLIECICNLSGMAGKCGIADTHIADLSECRLESSLQLALKLGLQLLNGVSICYIAAYVGIEEDRIADPETVFTKAANRDIDVDTGSLIYYAERNRIGRAVLIADDLFGVEIVNALILRNCTAKGNTLADLLESSDDALAEASGEKAGLCGSIIFEFTGNRADLNNLALIHNDHALAVSNSNNRAIGNDIIIASVAGSC